MIRVHWRSFAVPLRSGGQTASGSRKRTDCF